MKKIRILIAFVLIIVSLCTSVLADDSITMYALDGRTASVPIKDIVAWSNVGWYTSPVITVYALDGRSSVIPSSEVSAWVSVGWYTYPPTVVYSLDGRSSVISVYDVDAWCSVGWYRTPVTMMYSADGRSIAVETSKVPDYQKVGWYTYQPSLTLPISSPVEFEFTSGAGGWGTTLTLYSDGYFHGQFHDSNMGETGYGYPGGTVYICDFSGRFGNIQVLDEYSYSMTLESLTLATNPGTQWISNKVLFVASEPYGLDGGKNFVFYKPNTPASKLTSDFKSWWMDWYNNPKPKTLTGYGIYNVSGEYGFFS